MSETGVGSEGYEDEEIPRGETGVRILLTLLFLLIVRVIEFVLGVVILFDLAFALITQRAPGERVRRFADRVIRYSVEIGQYLTYIREDAPFPFDEFPPKRSESGA